jgi:hypothetical protein
MLKYRARLLHWDVCSIDRCEPGSTLLRINYHCHDAKSCFRILELITLLTVLFSFPGTVIQLNFTVSIFHGGKHG